MANTLLTPTAVTRKALALFTNNNFFIRNIDKQYDDSFGRTGAKIGSSLRIRVPNDYVVRSGPTAVPQSTNESYITLNIGSQKGVDIAFSSVDRTLSLDDYAERVLEPAMNNLAAQVASDVISLAESVPNIVRATGTNNATVTPGFATFAMAGGVLDTFNAPRGDRVLLTNPISMARSVDQFKQLFNAQEKVGRQYSTGLIGRDVIGFDWAMDQTVAIHTTAAYGTLPTVAGAGQSGSTLTVSALTGPLNQGDIISIAGVNSVNRSSKKDTGMLAQFAVTANVPTGATSIPIYPAILGVDANGNAQPKQTVTASPANGAAISVATNAGESYRKNIAFAPQAFTMATADLWMPPGGRGVIECARESFNGVSMRMITSYDIINDQAITRFDVLYGFLATRPEWCVVVADAI